LTIILIQINFQRGNLLFFLIEPKQFQPIILKFRQELRKEFKTSLEEYFSTVEDSLREALIKNVYLIISQDFAENKPKNRNKTECFVNYVKLLLVALCEALIH